MTLAAKRLRRSLRAPWKPGRKMRSLHVSHVETYGDCPQLFDYRINLGVRSASYASALVVGRAMHAASAALRAGLGLQAAMAAAANEIAAAPKPRPEDQQQAAIDGARCAIMLEGYWRRWRHELGPVETPHNEVLLSAPLINPASDKESRSFYLEGTLDGWVPRSAGPALYEQKTTSDTLDETEAYLRAGLQIPIYCELLRFNIGEPAGVVIDLVKKPVVKRREAKGESLPDWGKRCLEDYAKRPDHFFRRVELPYSESQARWALEQFWRTAEAIRNSDRNGYLQVRSWKVCKGPTGWCRFKSLCWHSDLEGYEQEE